MENFLKSVSILFVLLNPFTMTLYLIELMRGIERRVFQQVLIRAAAISGSVFVVFAMSGDYLFRELLQARFAAFLVFGGIIFLIIALQMVFRGARAIKALRGNPEHIAGAIAMPFMIGPGTVSASVLIGTRLSRPLAVAAILCALTLTVVGLVALKAIHDRVEKSHAAVVERYLDLVGRVASFVIGTIAVEMIMQGIDLWQKRGG
jgi:multiple antibiotic resistance protein